GTAVPGLLQLRHVPRLRGPWPPVPEDCARGGALSTLARPLPGKTKSSSGATGSSRTLPTSARVQLEGWEPGALILIVGLMFCFGLVELYSASALMAREEGQPSYFYALRQFFGLGSGIIVAAVFSRINYLRLHSLAWPLLLILLGCLFVMIL